VLSGYFAPALNQVPEGNKPGAPPVYDNVFYKRPALQLINTPRDYVTRVPLTDVLPSFFLAAGAADRTDVLAAQQFRTLLLTRTTDVPLDIVPSGGHVASVWRGALGPMLTWMTPQLAESAARANAAAAAAAAERKAHARPAPERSPAVPKK
jgi:hypothetical protein